MKTENKTIRIIVVDDEERLLRILRLGLKPLGYDVETSSDADEALKKILAEPFDIILTDLKMPGMRGDEFVFELERLGVGVPIVVMTAYADVDTAVKTLKHGAADYIKKPFTIEEIDAALRNIIRDTLPVTQEELVSLKSGVALKEKEIIERALVSVGNNKTAAAKVLKISERSLWYKLKRYNIG